MDLPQPLPRERTDAIAKKYITIKIPYLQDLGPLVTKLGSKNPFMTGVIQSVESRVMAFLYGEKS